jgi:hypothetical protein
MEPRLNACVQHLRDLKSELTSLSLSVSTSAKPGIAEAMSFIESALRSLSQAAAKLESVSQTKTAGQK